MTDGTINLEVYVSDEDDGLPAGLWWTMITSTSIGNPDRYSIESCCLGTLQALVDSPSFHHVVAELDLQLAGKLSECLDSKRNSFKRLNGGWCSAEEERLLIPSLLQRIRSDRPC